MIRALFLFFAILAPLLASAAEQRPDMVALARASKDYQDGYFNDAVFQLKKAAKFGNTSGHMNLAIMYAGGLGIPEDDIEACAWMILSAVRGEAFMLQTRNDICAPLTNEQQASARVRAKELNEDYGDHAALQNRRRWARDRKRELTGSRTGSVGNVRIYEATDPSNVKGPTEFGYNLYDKVAEYVTEMEDIITRVEYGELTLVDD